MVRIEDSDQIWSKRKALIALFPYFVWQDRGGADRMVDAFLGITRSPKIGGFMTEPITTLLAEANSTNRVVTLLSPYANWGTWRRLSESTVTWWAASASTIPYTEKVGQSVVAALLRIASNDHLQPYIPIDIWAWLKKRPSLPPICEGRKLGTSDHVVRRVRELGDVELIESYFLVVWSEWDRIYDGGLREMCISIREDFGGIGMWRSRENLINRLDHVLGKLGVEVEQLWKQNPDLRNNHVQTAKRRYERLKEVLLEVDREVLEVLTRTPFRLFSLFSLLTSADIHRSPFDVHLRSPSPMPVVTHPQHLLLVRPTRYSFLTWVPPVTPSSSIDRCLTLQISNHVVPRHLQTWEICCPYSLGRRWATRRLRRVCHNPSLYVFLCSTTCHFTPPSPHVPVLSSYPSPHSSRFPLNSCRTVCSCRRGRFCRQARQDSAALARWDRLLDTSTVRCSCCYHW